MGRGHPGPRWAVEHQTGGSAIEGVRIGVIGCGKISDVYLENCGVSDDVEVVACADLDEGRAREKAAAHGVPRAGGVAELLEDEEVEVVLNLTVPQAHATVSLAALREGKTVHTEKPLAIELDDARRMLDEAGEGGLRIGCAPDTFLGGGLQTCRKLLDEGAIGEPVAATAHLLNHGPEDWHPDPDFFYQYGAGPMFDMGPYYLTALATLIGPVRRVAGPARATFSERDDHERTQARREDSGQQPDPRRGGDGLRERLRGHPRHQLRRLDGRGAGDRDLRQRRHAPAAGSQHVRRPGPVCGGPTETGGRTCP